MFADDRQEPQHLSRRITGTNHHGKDVDMNTNVALLLGLLAGGIGGTAALQTLLERARGKRRTRGAPFHPNG
ncbi:hypothetical protein EEB14_24820 [Rhodococcus sp. WS4]|nr:hypothetical protein EEB14_24820 [Rhodococcus sp. WS4]